MLACDILTSVGNEALAKMQKGVTKALVNTALVMPAQFTREPDLKFPLGSMEQEIKDAVGSRRRRVPRRHQARHGASWATRSRPTCSWSAMPTSAGSFPCREAAILQAIELNGAAIESNTLAFRWGRLAAVEPAKVAAAALPAAAQARLAAPVASRSTR